MATPATTAGSSLGPGSISAEPSPEPTVRDLRVGGQVGDQAPEFEETGAWINSDPLDMASLRGKVVLIDFWTYTCVNCIRTFPFLSDWHAKYADLGLVVVGVHAPEFQFERLTENVIAAAERYQLDYAIVQDNEFATWRAYDNHVWPAKYLIDPDGIVRFVHLGEGAYQETEELIRELLEQSGADLSGIPLDVAPGPQRREEFYFQEPGERLTRELYAGYVRNAAPRGLYVANTEYYEGNDRTIDYVDPGEHLNQFLYLQGLWENGADALRHARVTDGFDDYVALSFLASSVNAVIEPRNDVRFEVQVTIDDRPVRLEEAGSDLVVEARRSYLVVDAPRMYQILDLPGYESHEMTLSSNSDAFSLLAMTFGAYEEGP